MIYTPLIQKAITFATKVHHTDAKQTRKGSDIPYIIHPLGVALIVARVTQDDETIAAALLHDTLEDCKPYGSVTKKMISDMFGEKVARIVNDLTEQDKSLSWAERKMLALAHIKEMEHDAILVKSADILYNVRDLINDIEEKGLDAFAVFNAPMDTVVESYSKRVTELARVWPDNPLTIELQSAVENLIRLSKD